MKWPVMVRIERTARVWVCSLASIALLSGLLEAQIEAAETKSAVGHRIEGTVLDRHGVELEGVSVALFAEEGLFEQGNRTLDWTSGSPPVVAPLARARTDERGRYGFEGIGTGVYRVEVAARGRHFKPEGVLVSPIRLEAELRELGVPESVVVEPLREEARPGTWVRPELELGSARAFLQRVLYRGGSPLLHGRPLVLGRGLQLPPLEFWEAWVIWGEGLVPHREQGSRFGGVDRRVFRYPAHTAVARQIRVVGPDLSPTAGVLLFFQGVAIARGDSEGRLALPLSAEKEVGFYLLADSLAGKKVSYPAQGSTRSGSSGSEPEVVMLDPPVHFSGRVLGSDGTPVSEALVRTDSAFASSDSRGRFSLALPPDWSTWVIASSRSHEEARWLGNGLLEDRQHDFSLEPTGRAFGRITGGGDPVGAARVDFASSHALTNDRGYFLVPALTSQFSSRIRVAARGLATRESDLAAAERVALSSRPAASPQALRFDTELDGGRQLRGWVVDRTEAAIGGATIELSITQSSSHQGVFPFMGRRSGRRTVASVESAVDGSFDLEHIGSGFYDLEVTASGFTRARIRGLEVNERDPSVRGAPDPVLEIGTIAMALGWDLSGSVVDEDGSPIPGALLKMGPQRRRFPEASDGLERLSNDRGEFWFDGLERSQELTLQVSADGYAPRRLEIQTPPDRSDGEPPGVELLVELESAGSLVARVVDANGMPMADSQVQVRSIDAARSEPGRSFAETTDDLGSARFVGLRPGRWLTSASHEEWRSSVDQPVQVRLEREAEVELALRRGATVSGRVVLADGSPVADAHVMAQTFRRGRSRTDNDGRFSLAGLAVGDHEVRANHRVLGSGRRTIRVEEQDLGSELELDIELQPHVAISGVVFTPEGSPVTGGSVSMAGNGMFRGDGINSQGEFDMRISTPGIFTLSFECEGYRIAELGPTELGVHDIEGLEIHLEATDGGSIRGRVVGLDLDGLAETSVRARLDRHHRSATVDYRGEFLLEALDQGEWEVTASAGTGQRASELVSVSAGRLAEVELDLAGNLELFGSVTSGGVLEPGVDLRLTSLSDPTDTRFVRVASGEYRVAGLRPGGYRLEVIVAGQTAEETEVDLLESQRFDIELDMATVTVRVVEAETGAALPEASVQLETAQPGIRERRTIYSRQPSTEAGGEWRSPRVPAGSYLLLIKKDGYAAASRPVSARGSDLSVIEVELERSDGLEIRAILPGGQLATSVEVRAFDARGTSVFHGNGRLVGDTIWLRSFPTAADLLQVGHRRSHGGEVLISRLPAGVVEVHLRPTGKLRIRAPDLGGEDAGLEILDSLGRPASTPWPQYTSNRLDRRGVEFDLLPGTYRVEATTRSGRVFTGAIDLAPTADVILELE